MKMTKREALNQVNRTQACGRCKAKATAMILRGYDQAAVADLVRRLRNDEQALMAQLEALEAANPQILTA